MLNGRAICLGVFWILFVAAAFGQDQSGSQVITVPEKIDLGKLNTTVGKLNTTVGKTRQNCRKTQWDCRRIKNNSHET